MQQVQTRGFWTRHPEYSMPEMLTTAEKNDLVDTATTFDILAVRQITHRQYGKTWVLTVDVLGFARSVFLSCNDVRDPMIEDIAAHIKTTGENVPAILTQFMASNGHEAWGIAQPPNNDTRIEDVPFMSISNSELDAEQASYGDDHTSAGYDADEGYGHDHDEG